jgi:RimJ/RimL family protein N-acetyltransferase
VVALLDYLFTVLNKHRVFASVDPRNEASMALLRSVGMRQEAHFRQSLFWKGEWVDDVVLGLLRSEWKYPSTPVCGGPR